MKERILQFLKSENKSSAQFAEEIGVQPSGISHIISGRNKPSLDFMLKMLDRYQYLSTEWLLFGKGKMYKEEAMNELFDESLIHDKDSDLQKYKINHVVEEDNTTLPLTIKPLKEKTTIDRIVIFNKDRTFTEYMPDTESDKKS